MFPSLPTEIILSEIIDPYAELDGAVGVLRLVCRALADMLKPPDSLEYAKYITMSIIIHTDINSRRELLVYAELQRSRALQIALEYCPIEHRQKHTRKASRIFWIITRSIAAILDLYRHANYIPKLRA